MINTTKAIGIYLQDSTNIFEDILTPIKNRKKQIKAKSHVLPIYFYKYIGIDKDEKQYYKSIADLDSRLSALGDKYIKFTSSLPNEIDGDILHKVEEVFNNYTDIGIIKSNVEKLVEEVYNQGILSSFNNITLDYSVKKSLRDIIKLYIHNEALVTSTAMKNFLLKLISWMNRFLSRIVSGFNIEHVRLLEVHNPKIIFYGPIKKHEVYFLILLSSLGCDILYINSSEDNSFAAVEKNNSYSKLIKLPYTTSLKEFPTVEERTLCTSNKFNVAEVQNISSINKSEKSFEELASLSTSTVMIKKYDRDDKVIGTGSGVVVNDKGLIITNFHVIRNGIYYGIIFENVQKEFYTYTVISWNEERDLALLKINLNTSPIVLNSSDNIKRGQKVVAIGSPLGLMNTISDGIVSGFRRSEVEDFIQITAPISPGSSGGALFNMYGELIGITSAGYLEGQNINLAIPTKYVESLINEEYTRLNLEVMNKCSCFYFDTMRFNFDGFFRHGQGNIYRISLYRFEYSEYDFYTLTKNRTFSEAFERYYMDTMIQIAQRYNLHNLQVEVGSENYVLAFSFSGGRVIHKEWRNV